MLSALVSLPPEVGLLLADKITAAEFWKGQRAIGHTLRDLRDAEDRPFIKVKDEQRGKYKIKIGEHELRDDQAEKIIAIVEKPVQEKIGAIRNSLYKGAEAGYRHEVDEAAMKCMGFSDPKSNGKFIKGLSDKNE